MILLYFHIMDFVKEHKHFFDYMKVNVPGIGAVAVANTQTLDDMVHISEAVQSFAATIIVIVILIYNIVKTYRLIFNKDKKGDSNNGKNT